MGDLRGCRSDLAPPFPFGCRGFGHELDVDRHQVLLEPGDQSPGELLGEIEEVVRRLGADVGDQDPAGVVQGDVTALGALDMREAG